MSSTFYLLLMSLPNQAQRDKHNIIQKLQMFSNISDLHTLSLVEWEWIEEERDVKNLFKRVVAAL